eukprot:3870473-Rhodomonas_salina.2
MVSCRAVSVLSAGVHVYRLVCTGTREFNGTIVTQETETVPISPRISLRVYPTHCLRICYALPGTDRANRGTSTVWTRTVPASLFSCEAATGHVGTSRVKWRAAVHGSAGTAWR